jgi:hypothetical protein
MRARGPGRRPGPAREPKETTMSWLGPIRRRKYNVHPIQQKYFFLSLLPLFFFTITLILLVLFPLNVSLMGSDVGRESTPTLREIFALMDVRIWLALLISMLVSCLLSYIVTNKFAGHIYRIEQVLERTMMGGELPSTLQVREGDDLKEFVELLDGSFKTISVALTGINTQHALAAGKLTALQRKIPAGPNGEMRQTLEEIRGHLQEVEKILANFKLPAAHAPDATRHLE